MSSEWVASDLGDPSNCTISKLNRIYIFCQIVSFKVLSGNIPTNIISEPFDGWLSNKCLIMSPSPLWADFNHNLIGKILTNYFMAFEQPQWVVMIQYSCQRLTSTHHNSEHLIRNHARIDFQRLNTLDIVKKKKIILPSTSPKHSIL